MLSTHLLRLTCRAVPARAHFSLSALKPAVYAIQSEEEFKVRKEMYFCRKYDDLGRLIKIGHCLNFYQKNYASSLRKLIDFDLFSMYFNLVWSDKIFIL